MTDRQHLENCVKRSTRLTGTIARLTQLKVQASHHEQQFDAHGVRHLDLSCTASICKARTNPIDYSEAALNPGQLGSGQHSRLCNLIA